MDDVDLSVWKKMRLFTRLRRPSHGQADATDQTDTRLQLTVQCDMRLRRGRLVSWHPFTNSKQKARAPASSSNPGVHPMRHAIAPAEQRYSSRRACHAQQPAAPCDAGADADVEATARQIRHQFCHQKIKPFRCENGFPYQFYISSPIRHYGAKIGYGGFNNHRSGLYI